MAEFWNLQHTTTKTYIPSTSCVTTFWYDHVICRSVGGIFVPFLLI